MAALATLPVFFTLAGKRAVVAGGSAAAAWKAELLAAAGAEVHVYAEELDPVFEALIVSGCAAGRLVHHGSAWRCDVLPGAVTAICDAEDEEEAARFFRAAQAAGVPVNVIDRPAWCDFQFGSIVNRSPAVIAISTDGAAPILGQAIRRRIETLLPPALADWAALARDLRETVMAKLSPGPRRRAFWERFADRAFGPAPKADAAEQLIGEAVSVATDVGAGQGRVTLVGAGPGDSELLTLKAVRALQAADVILFDDLASDDVLELARREARRMLVGKRGGRESCRQGDINAMMVSLAKAGNHVVRLKGGDPMVFGRAGEEIARLQSEGIPVSVVPGITSALAMAASLGVSLTFRDCARSVRFVTGHSRQGRLPDDLDWNALADPAVTTIFYMAGRTAGEIAAALITNGGSPDMPVVVAKAVSRRGEGHWAGQLSGLGAGMAAIGYDDPVLVGVGRVFEDVARDKIRYRELRQAIAV
jgi:uroporphyrin-III C-methyltransferase/precorrin-2 dehydrogenase/sirohydrochlorin ferrochelatase